MSNDAFETVINRQGFYKDNFHITVILLLVSIVLNILMGAAVYQMSTYRPQPEYFATASDGRITPLYPLSQPVFSQSAILQWATQAAVKSYTYNFVNYRQQLQDASDSFTPAGWSRFKEALLASNNLKSLLALKLVATAVPTGTPIVQDTAVLDGRYAWKVQIPMLVTYQSASTSIPQPVVITMVIIRVPTVNNPKGIAIEQFVAAVAAQNTVGGAQ